MTSPSRPPAVYAGLTQVELDRAYDQDAWATNAAEVQARIMAKSREVARRTPPQACRYGTAEQQVIDIFVPRKASGAPVFILIHGGAWRLSMRGAFYGSAPAITAAGGILAVVGFACLPAVSLPQMVEQVRRAVFWIAAEIGAFGGDPGNLHLVGHSSGAHLAAAVLTSDAAAMPPAVRSGTLISGVYDLEPVMLSSRRHYIDLTAGQAVALSPIRRPEQFAGIGHVWWGGRESPEFKRQSHAFAGALHAVGRLGQSTMLDGCNHFEMLEELDDPDGPIIGAMMAGADPF